MNTPMKYYVYRTIRVGVYEHCVLGRMVRARRLPIDGDDLGQRARSRYPAFMPKRFLTDVIQQSSGLTGVASGRLAAELIAAIKAEIVENGRFSLPDFGSFTVRETPKRTALNPKTGEKVAVKAGATVRFKVSPTLKAEALAGLKKSRRKAAKVG